MGQQFSVVFVSATSGDLGTARVAVSNQLVTLGILPVEQSFFETDHRPIREMLEAKLASCSAVIHIAGFRYGAEPKARPEGGARQSFTQLEFEIADKMNKPIFVFITTDQFPFDECDCEDDEVRRFQLAYRERLRARDNLWYKVSTVAELRERVSQIRFPESGQPELWKPRNLPYLSLGSGFVGREAILTTLRKSTGSAVRQVIQGLGGVGKSRLAVEYGWRYQADYTALLYVSADTTASLRRNMAGLCEPTVLNLVEQSNPNEAARAAAAIRWLGSHAGWLLILDNADTPEVFMEVMQYLPRLGDGHVIITSRLADWAPGVTSLTLDVLETEPAAELLLQGATGLTDRAEAAALAKQLGGLPLALEQAAAFVTRNRWCSVAEYRKRWAADEPHVREWLLSGLAQRVPVGVAVTWRTSFDQLTPEGRSLLNVLAWFDPSPIPADMIRKAMWADLASPEAAMDDLARSSLLKWETDQKSVTIHRLVQEVTRSQITESDRVRWIGLALTAADRYASAVPTDPPKWPFWATVRPHAQAIVLAADASGLVTLALARLMGRLAQFLTHQAADSQAEPLLRRALAISERVSASDPRIVATCLNDLAVLLRRSGRAAAAEPLLCRALEIDLSTLGSDSPVVGTRLNNLAAVLRETNRSDEAESLFRRALAINEKAFGPDHETVAGDLNNLAVLLGDKGDRVTAENLLRRVVGIWERSATPNHPNHAATLSTLAGLLQDTHRATEAEGLLRRALAIDEAVYSPDHPEVAADLHKLAILLHMTGRPEMAVEIYERALLTLRAFRLRVRQHLPERETLVSNYRMCLVSLGRTEADADARILELLGTADAG